MKRSRAAIDGWTAPDERRRGVCSRARQALRRTLRMSAPEDLHGKGPSRRASARPKAWRAQFSGARGERAGGAHKCPYRWFVEHEMKPVRLEPESDPLWLGAIVHAALERLYRDPPGEDSIPRPSDLGRWKKRFSELLERRRGTPPWAASGSLPRRGPRGGVPRATGHDQDRVAPDPTPDRGQLRLRGRKQTALQIGQGESALNRRRPDRRRPEHGEAVIQDYKSEASVDGGTE